MEFWTDEELENGVVLIPLSYSKKNKKSFL